MQGLFVETRRFSAPVHLHALPGVSSNARTEGRHSGVAVFCRGGSDQRWTLHLRSGPGGFGIGQVLAKREIFARLVGAGSGDTCWVLFSLLGGTVMASSRVRFELTRNPRSSFFGADDDGVKTLFSFMKALSCSLAATPVLVLVMLDFMLVRPAPLDRGFMGLAALYSLFGPSIYCPSALGTIFTASCIRHVLYPLFLLISFPTINKKICNLCVFVKNKFL